MTADTTMRSLLAACAVAVLAACGGGDKVSDSGAPAGASVKPTSDAEAVRFLQQATFGATAADIARVKQIGYENWINEQFTIPRSSHLEFLTTQVPLPIPANTQVSSAPLYYSFWRQAIAAPDQLRQRAAFTLSQILVTSAAEAQLSNDADDAHGLAAYLDILSEHSFGNYRDILQAVSTHPTMGVYLTSLGNRGDNGRTPDENYAREVMQLFTIGLFELNMDGTQKLVNGQPIETYDMDDIRNLAKVFTGWSWGNQGAPSTCNARFTGGGCNGGTADPMRRVIPMQFYPQFHSPDAKTFLSVTIPAGTNGVDALRTALDTLFAHPNIAPFIAKQYIQRMVTSNPSPAYVEAVAQAFASGSYTTAGTNRTFGSGRRGDLRAVVAATLLHPEARTVPTSPDAGKLREPVLRLAALLRSFEATSQTGNWRIGDTDATLFQTPMKAPSVFNFFRPGYVPPNTGIASKPGLVAPEFQIAHEVSVATYANTMQNWVANGLGSVPADSGLTGNDVRPQYTTARSLATNPDQLADHLNLMLTGNAMDAATRTAIRDAIASVPTTNTNLAANRVNLGVFMTMMSPEFLVQK